VLLDSKADLLVYGNAERAIVEIAHRLARGQAVEEIRDLRGTAFAQRGGRDGFVEIDSTEVDAPGLVTPLPDPYASEEQRSARRAARGKRARSRRR
jgi:radical SAM superfamily enzyme YgiQ (UPF0313 family)